MQRIDENTYIDDTLVTCAEYQLFIDEMREQGKYYQPDHWISYQFPIGQAREPILGVRHSDAVAFCEWLISREKSKWKYRLPNQEEANNFPIMQNKRSTLGYWVGENYQFSWLGNVSKDARRIELNSTIDRARNIDKDIDLTRNHDSVNSAFALGKAMMRALEIVLVNAHNRARLRPLTLDLDIATIPNIAFDRDLKGSIDTRNILIQILKYEDGYFLRSALERSSRKIKLSHALDEVREFILDVFIDIYTLEERIVGRSPAFEGIRLVKERIR